ncbi:MAG: protein kinase domain-containing protein [Bradymonadia bacterium]
MNEIPPGTRLSGVAITALHAESDRARLYTGAQLTSGRSIWLKQRKHDPEGEWQARGERLTSVAATHLPHVLAVDAHETYGSYWIMTGIDGEPVTRQLDASVSFAPARAALITLQVCQGLAALHSAGLCHGDLSAEHVLIARGRLGERAGLISGDGKQYRQEVPTAERAMWMSPEHATDAPLDARSDIYQAGLLLFTLLNGAPPFRGRDPLAIIQRHAHMVPPEIKSLRPDVPAPFSEILHLCLAKDPDDRYPRVESLIRRLRPLSRTLVASQSLQSTGLERSEGIIALPRAPQPDEAPTADVEASPAVEAELTGTFDEHISDVADPFRSEDTTTSDLPFDPSPLPRNLILDSNDNNPTVTVTPPPLMFSVTSAEDIEDPFGGEVLTSVPDDSLQSSTVQVAPVQIPEAPKPPSLGDRFSEIMARYLERLPKMSDQSRGDLMRTPTPTSILGTSHLSNFVERLVHLLDGDLTEDGVPEDLLVIHDALAQLETAHDRAMLLWRRDWSRATRLHGAYSDDCERLGAALQALETDIERATTRLDAHEGDIRHLTEVLQGFEVTFIERFSVCNAADFDAVSLAELDKVYLQRTEAAEDLARLSNEANRLKRKRADLLQQHAELERSQSALSTHRWSEVEDACLSAAEAARKAQQVGAALEQRCMQLGLAIARHAHSEG